MKQPIWKPFFRLLHQARLPYFYILLYTLLSISASQLYLLFPSYTQQIMQGNINQTMALMVAAVVLGQAFVTSVNQFVLAAASAKVTLRFREMIWGQILRLPVPFFDGQPSGNLISRITQDTSKLSDLTATLPGNVLSSLYMFFGAFGILFSYHWKLAALEAVMIPFLYGLGVWQGRIQFSWNQKIQEKIAGLTGHLSEILSSPALVKGFCAEEWETKRGSGWISQLFQADFFRSLINTLLLQLKNLASLIHTAAMIGLGLWMISRKEITIDVWVAFYLYSQNLLNSFSRIMSIWTTVKSAQGAVRRITELMEESTETSGSSADSGFGPGGYKLPGRDVFLWREAGPGTSYLYSRRGKNDGAHWVQRGWKNHRFPASGTLLYPGPGNDPDRRQGYFFFSSGGMEAYDRLRSPGSLPFFWDDPGKYPLRCPQACYRPGTLPGHTGLLL